jgi:hypothetical protein
VTLATPEALVTAVVAESEALAPLFAAANVTIAPLTGFPDRSLTVACSALAKAVDIVADWDTPPVAVILAGVANRLVSEKVAVAAPPHRQYAGHYRIAAGKVIGRRVGSGDSICVGHGGRAGEIRARTRRRRSEGHGDAAHRVPARILNLCLKGTSEARRQAGGGR